MQQITRAAVPAILFSCFLPRSSTLGAADVPLQTLPRHLQQSRIPTQGEIDFVASWAERITAAEALGSLADPATRDTLLSHIYGYIEREGTTMYRQDAGIIPPDEDPQRVGIAEMQHIAGLYAMQDQLRTRYPDLVMEGCCGGGRRIDLESLSRFHWHQKSDRWFDTISDHSGLYGANLFLPGGVINVPTEATDDYGTWSSFAGQLCLAWHPLDEDFPAQQAQRQVEFYKRIRHMLSGDFYPLTECSLTASWLGHQFHRNDLDEGFALLFKRNSNDRDRIKFAPRGLHPHTKYEFHFQTGNSHAVFTGNQLAAGTEVAIAGRRGAELVIYNRQSARTRR